MSATNCALERAMARDTGNDDAIPDLNRGEERYLAAAIAVREGWCNRTGLAAIAFRPAEVDKATLDRIEERLVEVGCLEKREGRFSGRHGGSTPQYRATSLIVRNPTLSYAELVTTLAPSDRLVLVDFAHAQAELEVAEGRPGIWLRISTALQTAERDATVLTESDARELDAADPDEAVALDGRA